MTGTSAHPFETGLDRSSANYVPLTPVSFLYRAASAFANKTAVIDGERRLRTLLELDREVADLEERRFRHQEPSSVGLARIERVPRGLSDKDQE